MLGSDPNPSQPTGTTDCMTQSRDAALARIPHTEFLLTARFGDAQSGLIVQRVQVCGTNPAMVLIAMEKGHALSPLIRDSRTFGLSLLGIKGRLLSRLFRDERGTHDDPFIAFPIKVGTLGAPIITRADAWYDCEVIRHFDVESNFEVYVGLVRDAAVERVDPSPLPLRATTPRSEAHLRTTESARLPHIPHLPKMSTKARGRRA